VERVLDLLLETYVAAADGDRLELGLGVAQGDQQREDVVARGVGVDDQPRHTATATRASSSARVGRPGITPGCSTMCAPAAQPQRTASRSEAPSASATANAAQNASPAPVVSTARAGNAGTPTSRIRAPRSPRVTTSVPSASSTAATSVSFGVRTSAAAICVRKASTCAGARVESAPGTITIRLSPLGSTRIAAVIVGSGTRR